MACIQIVRVLISGIPLTHRDRVLIDGELSIEQAMVSTIINYLYTVILIPFNENILFVIEINVNRVNRKK